jgi:hypothetical protein
LLVRLVSRHTSRRFASFSPVRTWISFGARSTPARLSLHSSPRRRRSSSQSRRRLPTRGPSTPPRAAAASAGEGGEGLLEGSGGGCVASSGLRPIQRHRTAPWTAALRTQCVWRTDDTDSGRHGTTTYCSSHPWSRWVRCLTCRVRPLQRSRHLRSWPKNLSRMSPSSLLSGNDPSTGRRWLRMIPSYRVCGSSARRRVSRGSGRAAG